MSLGSRVPLTTRGINYQRSCNPILEQIGRRRFGVEHFKCRQQLGDLQHFSELAA
jgi:hypothetical protein